MNWALFGSTFMLIFLAELGDKTQLAVMSQSAASSAKWTVFTAGALALITSTAFGVLAGDLLRRFVPDERYIKCAGGVLFLIFGVLMLREAFFPRRQVVAADARNLCDHRLGGSFVISRRRSLSRLRLKTTRRWRRVRLIRGKGGFERLALEERWHHEAMMVRWPQRRTRPADYAGDGRCVARRGGSDAGRVRSVQGGRARDRA